MTDKIEMQLSTLDVLALDYHGKIQALDLVLNELIQVQIEYSKIAGEMATLKAKIDLLKQIKSGLQSSIRAEGVY